MSEFKIINASSPASVNPDSGYSDFSGWLEACQGLTRLAIPRFYSWYYLGFPRVHPGCAIFMRCKEEISIRWFPLIN